MKRAIIRCNIEEITLMKCGELIKICIKRYSRGNSAPDLLTDL